MKPILKATELQHQYPDGTWALQGINLQVFPGEYLALVGENGAGKTTLAKHANGLLRATSGEMEVAGVRVGRRPVAEIARTVGYVFQNPDHQIFCDRVEREVAFGPENLNFTPQEVGQAVDWALHEVGIAHLRRKPPFELSRGERQRLAIASVLAMRPEVLILDEPTTGQDRREARQIMGLLDHLHSQGRTIIIITHDMSLVARHAQRVVALCQGKVLIDGAPNRVFADPKRLAQTHLEPPQVAQVALGMGWAVGEVPLLPGDLVKERRLAYGRLA